MNYNTPAANPAYQVAGQSLGQADPKPESALEEILRSLNANVAHAAGLSDRVRALNNRLMGAVPEAVSNDGKAESKQHPPLMIRLADTAALLGSVVDGLHNQVERLERL